MGCSFGALSTVLCRKWWKGDQRRRDSSSRWRIGWLRGAPRVPALSVPRGCLRESFEEWISRTRFPGHRTESAACLTPGGQLGAERAAIIGVRTRAGRDRDSSSPVEVAGQGARADPEPAAEFAEPQTAARPGLPGWRPGPPSSRSRRHRPVRRGRTAAPGRGSRRSVGGRDRRMGEWLIFAPYKQCIVQIKFVKE